MARTTGSHADVTGPRIRAAAERLFAQRGFAAVSMRQIAAEVGVQAGALYNYTPDKQALLFDLMQTHMKELLEALQGLPAQPNALARLEQFARFHIRFHLDRPDAVFIAYMELRNLSEVNFAAIETQRQRYEDMVTSILDAGRAEGTIVAADTKVATRAVIAMLTGVTTWYKDSGALSRAEVEDMYCAMVRRAVAV